MTRRTFFKGAAMAVAGLFGVAAIPKPRPTGEYVIIDRVGIKDLRDPPILLNHNPDDFLTSLHAIMLESSNDMENWYVVHPMQMHGFRYTRSTWIPRSGWTPA